MCSRTGFRNAQKLIAFFFSRRTHSQFNQPYLLLTSDALIFNEFSCSHFEAICSVSTVFC